jgi:hypothetical protein
VAALIGNWCDEVIDGVASLCNEAETDLLA